MLHFRRLPVFKLFQVKKNTRYGILCHCLWILLLSAGGCKKPVDPVPAVQSGHLVFMAAHQVEGQALELNQLRYTNAAGNEYMVTDLMYFISDITLYPHAGTKRLISDRNNLFYLDEKIPSTLTLALSDKIPAGSYDSISFTFGISEARNKSYIYVNPPEVLMGWPEVLGGGYHYMMMNGKWKDPAGQLQPFNFHLGIGQLYHGTTYNVDSIYAFVHNCFRVSLPGSSFDLADGDTATFRLTMNIGQWFQDPHVYDHNYWGGAIMQNQPAMQMAKENGWNVFSITRI
jgi:hypothetical protein